MDSCARELDVSKRLKATICLTSKRRSQPPLKKVLFDPSRKTLLVIRQNLLEDFLKLFDKRELRIFKGKDQRIVHYLLAEIKKHEN